MEDAIGAYAAQIPVTSVDPALVISKALTMYDGTVASGGSRYEAGQIAMWEFKTGSGIDRLRHQRCTARDQPDPVRRRQLGRRLGHQHPQRPRPGLDDLQQEAARPDHANRRVQHRGVGRTRQREPGRRAHRHLLRRLDPAQFHAGPDAVQLRLLQSQQHVRRQRRSATADLGRR